METTLFATATQPTNSNPASIAAAMLTQERNEEPMEIIKVSANSRSTAVAGAIAGVIRETRHAEVQAIGASAVNQAIKAVAIARGYLALDDLDIVCVPTFAEVEINGNERTAVRLSIETR